MFINRDKKYASAVIVAAGSGTRMKSGKNKIFEEICNKPVIAHTMLAFEKCDLINEITVVTKEEYILMISDIAKEFNITKLGGIVKGGDTRTESVKNGVMHTGNNYVAIHDGARPCIKPGDISSVIKKAFEAEAAAIGCPASDTLKRADGRGFIKETIDRSDVWQIQTPQVFKKDMLLHAYKSVDTTGATDDCMLMEAMGVKVAMVEGSRSNIKITVKDDLIIAKAILEEESK